MTDKQEALNELLEKLHEMDTNGLNPQLEDEIEGLACQCLIAGGGGCEWTNIAILRDKGYKVYAGDKDSFGWLTGVIENAKGEYVVYG